MEIINGEVSYYNGFLQSYSYIVGLTTDPFKDAIGKEILFVEIANDVLRISFTDGSAIGIEDHGQSCCEHRYMLCHDDLDSFIGAKLLGAGACWSCSFEDDEDAYGNCHEAEFINIITSEGTFQIASHNEHNGYYGGFNVVAVVL